MSDLVITTRRNVLKAVPAALAAVTVTGTTAAASIAAEHPDAEILRIAEEMHRLIEVWRPVEDAAHVAVLAFEEKHPVPRNKAGWKEWITLRGETGVEEKIKAACDISDLQIDPLEARLMTLRPRTIEGFAAKAGIICAWTAPDMWRPSDADCDWDKLAIRGLLDEMISAAEA